MSRKATAWPTSNSRMTAEQVEAFMQQLDGYFRGNWPTVAEFSPEDCEEVDLQEWERKVDWTIVDEGGGFASAEAVSEQRIRFTEEDYSAWLLKAAPSPGKEE